MDERTQYRPASRRSRWQRGGIAAAIAGGGLVAGIVIAGTLSATAADTSPTPAPNSSLAPGYGNPNGTAAPNGAFGANAGPAGGHAGETPLTGDAADKVKSAALDKYPDATVVRLETDSDGIYEAHLTKADGTPVTVEVGSDFTVTGEEAMPAPPNGAQAPNGQAPSGKANGAAVYGGPAPYGAPVLTG